MTSPREAVSILTAAALVVAPVGGVAATYTTGYADNGDGHTVKDDRDHDIPANYEEALVWIKEGKTLYKSCVDYMAGHADKFGGLTEAQHEVGRDRRLADTASNTVRTKITTSHDCSP